MQHPRIYFILLFVICTLNPKDLRANVELQPHRAYYTISLESAPLIKSDVTDVRGTMMVEYNKVDGGWTVQQISEFWKYSGDDEMEHVRWGYTVFESDDSQCFKFRTFRKVDDVVEDEIVGTAKKSKDHILVKYSKPEVKILKLSGDVLFPLQHLKELICAANTGEHMFPRIVFDGSTPDGPSEIDAFIGAKKENVVSEEPSHFQGLSYWPVRFSVYGLGKTTYAPEYVTTQDLLPTGIFTSYTLDDGAMKLRGILERVEFLKAE